MGLLSYPKRRLRKMVQKGEYAEALQFGRSLESEYAEDHDFMFIMGSIHYMLDDPRSAIPYFDNAVSLRHDDIEALMLKTNSHIAIKQTESAIACCLHILKIDPQHIEARSLLTDLQA